MEKVEILSIIVLALVSLSFIAYIVYNVKKKGLRQTAIDYICLAEQSFAKGENSQKMNYVIRALYVYLPNYAKLFITEDMLRNFIQSVFDEIKKALDTNR